jgi:hypothetical protein
MSIATRITVLAGILAVCSSLGYAQVITIECGKPTQGGKINIQLTEDSPSVNHLPGAHFRTSVLVDIDGSWSAARKCKEIADRVRKDSIGRGDLNVGLGENQVQIGVRELGDLFKVSEFRIKIDETNEFTGNIATVDPGGSTAVAAVPASDGNLVPPAGPAVSVFIFNNNAFCTGTANPDGVKTNGILYSNIVDSLGAQGCKFTVPFISATGESGVQTPLYLGPSSVFTSPGVTGIGSFFINYQPPSTPQTNNADTITTPDGAALNLGSPSATTISLTNNGNYPHILNIQYFSAKATGGTLPPVSNVVKTLGAGVTSFPLGVVPTGATNATVNVGSLIGTASGLSYASDSTKTFALTPVCQTPISGLSIQMDHTNFERPAGGLQGGRGRRSAEVVKAHLLLTNNGSAPVNTSGVALSGYWIVQTLPPSTRPATFVDPAGTLPVGCSFGGFQYFLPTTLPPTLSPGQTVGVDIDFTGMDQNSLSGASLNLSGYNLGAFPY